MSQTETSQYEMVVLFRPQYEAKLDDQLKIISDLVKNNNGQIVDEIDWGRRELAYKIADETHAIYRIYRLDLPASAPAKIETVLNITDSVIRHLITKIDSKVEEVIAAEKKARAISELAHDNHDNDE